MKLTMAEALVLSDALSQYLENQPHPELRADGVPLADVATAERLLDEADAFIASAAADPVCAHEWAYTGTAYGGDDESYHGEGRCYCMNCGADGDA